MRWALAVVALMLAVPAQAQEGENPNAALVRWIAKVDALAFDPRLFFDAPWGNMVDIRYRGDDWDWPVWSIAVRSGCVANEPRPACIDHRVARMLRAPIGVRGGERVRWRGADLVQRIRESGAEGDAAIRDQLDKAGLEWMEADLQACPGAIEMLARAEAARWGPFTPPRSDAIVISLHADTLAVDFRVPDGRVNWTGVPREGTPGRWADDFARLIEPCWKPATAPTPWRRVAAAD